jgi:signal transduction histidine kinase
MELENTFAELSKTLTTQLPKTKGREEVFLLSALLSFFDTERLNEANLSIPEHLSEANSVDFGVLKDEKYADVTDFCRYLISKFIEKISLPKLNSNVFEYLSKIIKEYDDKFYNENLVKSVAEGEELGYFPPPAIHTSWAKINTEIVIVDPSNALEFYFFYKENEDKQLKSVKNIAPGYLETFENKTYDEITFVENLYTFLFGESEDLFAFSNDYLTSICFPFFTPKLDTKYEDWLFNYYNLGTCIKSKLQNEIYSIESLMQSLPYKNKKKGVVIALVSDNYLISPDSKRFRKTYLENDLIEKIIKLPKDTVIDSNSHEVSLIIFNFNKLEKGFVLFDGKDEEFEETKVSNDDILNSNKIDLRADRYAYKLSNAFKDFIEDPNNKTSKIKDLLNGLPIEGRNYPPHNRITKSSKELIPYIRVSDLSDNKTSSDLDVSKIERKISGEKAHKRTIIDFSAVLVSKIAPQLKPTYFEFTGQPIVIGSDILALKLKENIDVEYFLMQLRYSGLVNVQLETMSSGIAIKRISTDDFLNIKIILPALEEQKHQALNMRGVFDEKAIIQEQLSIAKKEIETTEYDVIAAIAHNLNQKLGQIVDDYGTLILFLQNKEKNQTPISFDEMLRPIRNGELMENVPKFSKVANRLQNNLLDTAYTMKTTENILQKSSIDIESVDIIRFFKESVKADFDNPHFTIKVESKLKSLIVLADRHALKDAFRNLIENAKKHGFTQSNQKYQIVFEISKYTDNSGDNFARIVYKNNGNPFPKSYRFEDYTRLGTRMGKNKGTGIGGFFVKKVLDLHKGSFKEITLHENNQETFQIQMEILLPLAD